jgi:ATP-dependent exoDNAse (exonuclease V) alpha subunit
MHGVEVNYINLIRSHDHRDNTIVVTVAANTSEYLTAIANARNAKDWSTYYGLKDGVADLRLSYASTVYKSQGKSCNYVMVDVADILEKSSSLDEAKRLLYVAITRARRKVYLIWD